MKPTSMLAVLFSSSLWFTSVTDAEQIKLLPDDGQAEDQFGYSVAIDGTTALVGAHKVDAEGAKDAGAAYVYALGSSGWQLQTKLVASPVNEGDTLGGNVALNGPSAALGAIRRDDKGEDAGAVITFENTDGIWLQKAILTANDAEPGDAFGQSIAMTEEFLIIGAPHSNAPERDSGAAYVYTRVNNTWQLQTKLTAHDGREGDLFGISVAVDGQTILVGADLHDEKAENAGAVYAFVLDNQQWRPEGKLMAEDAGKTDIFGVRIALSGETALISARRDDVEEIGVDAGSAYIFERKGGSWVQTQKLTSPDGREDDRFARGVALYQDTAVISAMHHDANGNNAGAVYVFKKHHDQWRYVTKRVAKDGAAEDRFGWNLALSGDTAIIATPQRDDNGNASGAAYILDVDR